MKFRTKQSWTLPRPGTQSASSDWTKPSRRSRCPALSKSQTFSELWNTDRHAREAGEPSNMRKRTMAPDVFTTSQCLTESLDCLGTGAPAGNRTRISRLEGGGSIHLSYGGIPQFFVLRITGQRKMAS